MSFAFNAARTLYTRRIHPRVLMGPDDLARLRRTIRAGTGKKLFAALQRKVAPLRTEILAADDLPAMLAVWNAKWDNPGTLIVWGLYDLATVGVLAEDVQAIEAVRRVLLALPAADGILGRTGKNIGYGMEPYVPLAYDLIHDRLNVADRSTFVNWALDFYVRFALAQLCDNYFRVAGANIPMGVMLTGLTGLLTIEGEPGVPDLAAEKRQFALMLEAAIHTGIGPDGYPEEDGGYGFGMAGWIAYAVEAARRAGLLDAYRACPRFARFGRAMLHFVQPWGEYLSNTGDHGDDIGERAFILARLAQENKDPTLVWLLETLFYGHPTRNHLDSGIRAELPLSKEFQIPVTAFSLLMLDALKRRVHPAKARPAIPAAFKDAARGIVTFRSGWNPDAAFVVFDGSQRSPSAQGHFHYSSGHFSLTALGEYFAIDTGRYNIEQSCHNVVLVDGKSGRSTDGQWTQALHHGLLTDYRPGAFCDSAAVDSSHQHACYWARRTIGLVKGTGASPYLWTVEDINKANDWAEFWWQLHTSPENVIAIHDQSATITGWRKGNHLDVHFVLPAPESYPKPHVLALDQDVAGPSSVKYVGDVAAKAAGFARPSDMLHHCVWQRPRLLAKVGGYNGRFLSLLLPRRKGARPVKVERLPALDNVLAARLDFGAFADTLVFAYEHNLLEADGVEARGQWCVVRRAAKTGKVLGWELGHGSHLAVAGRRLV